MFSAPPEVPAKFARSLGLLFPGTGDVCAKKPCSTMQDDFNAGVFPGFFAGYQLGGFTTWFEINSDTAGELGWSLSENLQIADGVNVKMSVSKHMLDKHNLFVGMSFDF